MVVRNRFAGMALLVVVAFLLLLALQRTVAAGGPVAQQGTAVSFAQAATPTSTTSVTTTGQLTDTTSVTPVETQVAPIDTLRPAIGFSQTAMISPTQVLTGRAVEPGDSLPVSVSIQLVKVAEGLIDPINVVSARDGSRRLFVVERHGVIRIVDAEGQVVEEPFLDLSNIVLSAFLEQGLYDVEFHPDFAQNGRFFVHFAELLRNGDSLIVEYAVSEDDPNLADPNSAKVLLQIEQPWANHNGGELTFGPDGYLYIGSGDGGWEGDPLNAGQDLTTLLGKLLRIDVNVDDGRAYAIPPDNPFAQAATPRLVQLFGTTEQEFARIHIEARPEIWAYGLRNPWKFQFDRQTGDLYLPDVGQNFWEEINFQPADSPGGENYGWNFLMGTYCFPIEAAQCNAVGVLPVAQYSHVKDGCTIIGMGIYRGEDFADLNGIYFSGDYCSGKVWGLLRAEDGSWAYAQLLDTGLQFTGAGEDENGDLLVTSCHCNYGGGSPQENPPGEVWRIVPADQVPEGAETAPTQ